MPGEADGCPYLTMAYIDGPDLSAKLSTDLPPVSETLSLMRKLALAIQAAHDAGIIHRDLKPSNVMINQRGEPIVMDFGLARRAQKNEAELTHEGAILGSPLYMAPEQVHARHDEVGPQTDVYAMGVILYQMLCGHAPFSGSVASVLGQIADGKVPPTLSEFVAVDPRLEEICRKAMAPAIDQRYQSAGEFADALSDVEAELAKADKAPAESTEAPGRSRGKLALIAAAVLGIVLAGLLIYRIATPNGELIVHAAESANVQIEVKQDGKLIEVLSPNNGWKVSVKAGEYELSVKGASRGFRLSKSTVVVTRNDTAEVSIESRVASPTKKPNNAAIVRALPVRQLLPAPPKPTQETDGEFFNAGTQLKDADSRAIAAGDLDRDGDVDAVVVVHGQDYAVQILLNDGTGQFQPGERLAGENVQDVALGDMDADGDLDVVTTQLNQPKTQVFTNVGNASFRTPHEDPLAPIGSSIALADLDGDGDLDAALGAKLGCRIALNNGTGVLQTTQELGNLTTQDVALADLDGDGDVDLFTCSLSGANQVWWNNGRGTFTDSGARLGQSEHQSVALGDIDDDGDIDAFVAHTSHDNTLWVNNGNRQFVPVRFSDSNQRTAAVAIADLNGDGVSDLLAAQGLDSARPGPNQVLLRDNTGGIRSRWFGSSTTVDVVVADFDGDGDLDVFAANQGNNPDRLWLNRDRGEPLPTPWKIEFEDSGQSLGQSYSDAVALGDFDKDGDIDAVVATHGSSTNHVWLNQGNGSFEQGPKALGQFSTVAVAAGDLDGDGDLDVMFAGREGPNEVWLNDGKASFTSTGQRIGASLSMAIWLADFDDDGDLDAVFANEAGADKVWLNDGTGIFVAGAELPAKARGFCVAAIDVDQDADVDIVIGAHDHSQVWLNDGKGVFTPGEELAGSTYTFAVASGDVDDDGDVDLAFAVPDAPNQLYLNDGGGRFELSDQIFDSFSTQDVAFADIDKDGDLDLIFGCLSAPVGLWMNMGGGKFGHVMWLDAQRPGGIGIEDLNGDDNPDIFVANFGTPDSILFCSPVKTKSSFK